MSRVLFYFFVLLNKYKHIDSKLNSSLGNILNVGNDKYNSVEKLLLYYIENGYLPDVNSGALVPIMTSNTTPSGEVLASGTEPGDEPWKAFDGNNKTIWSANTENGAGEWVGYKFTKPVIAKKVDVGILSDKSQTHSTVFKIQASNDGSNWVNLTENLTNNVSLDIVSYNFNNINSYLYYRFYIVSQTHSTQYGTLVNTIQFYN